jgi:hypothetical protein
MSEGHEVAQKREAAMPRSEISVINKARRCLVRGFEHRFSGPIDCIQIYAEGIELLEEKMPPLDQNKEAMMLMVTLRDNRSESLELGQRCAMDPILNCHRPPVDDYQNQHMAGQNREIMSDCTYVLERRAYATKFQIKKCRNKRMNAACRIETNLGKKHSVTSHERYLALEDADAVLNEGDSEFGISWADVDVKPVRKMAFATKVHLGVPVDVCGNILHCEQNDPEKKLLLCTRCRTVKYCSRECQKEHYKDHKRGCKRLVEQNNLELVD